MEATIEHVQNDNPSSLKGGTSGRFLSLDVFRGLTICLMIIVNSPGKGADMYSYLVHAPWFGFTLADLVFPSFLFAVGNSMSFSMGKFGKSDDGLFFRKVIKRTILIFLIGYLMYWFPFFRFDAGGEWSLKPIGETRIMGVLQRIALCYFSAALMIRYLSKNATIIISACLLLLYWAILYLFGETGKELTMGGNAIVRLDLFLFGEGHVYKKDVAVFDPEGLLSTLPAIVNVLAGYWAGIFIREQGKSYQALTRLLIIGLIMVTAALWWGQVFPISKKLWTSSFVIYTIGIDVLMLSFLIYFIEFKKWKVGVEFFNIVGKNPLFIYLFSELLLITLDFIRLPGGQSVFEWISISLFQQIFPGAFGAFVTAIWFMMVCWLVGWWLDKRKIYIKI